MSIQVQLRRDTYANIMAASSPGAAGEVYVDTTNQRLVVNNGSLIGGFPAPVMLFVDNGGSTNNSSSGSGTWINHTPTFTIPANFMIAKRLIRVTVHFQVTSGSAPPTLSHRLLLGSTVIGSFGAIAVSASQTNIGAGFQWIFQATAAPSGSSNVQCTDIGQQNGIGSTTVASSIAMPVAVATNASQALTIATQWTTAGTGTTTISLNQLIVEALN